MFTPFVGVIELGGKNINLRQGRGSIVKERGKYFLVFANIRKKRKFYFNNVDHNVTLLTLNTLQVMDNVKFNVNSNEQIQVNF